MKCYTLQATASCNAAEICGTSSGAGKTGQTKHWSCDTVSPSQHSCAYKLGALQKSLRSTEFPYLAKQEVKVLDAVLLKKAVIEQL